MFKDVISKPIPSNPLIGRNQVLILGVILMTFAGLLAGYYGLTLLEITSSALFLPNKSAVMAGSHQPGYKSVITDATDRPISGLTSTSALVADPGNQIIRRIDLNTGEITTLAGQVGAVGNADGIGAEARFREPVSVAVSADRTFALVADTGNHTIRRIDLNTSEVTTLAGLAGVAGSNDGLGAAALFYYPRSVAISATGAFALVADTHNHAIRWIDLGTGQVTTLAGQAGVDGSADGIGVNARFYCPQDVGVSADDNFALVADYCNQTIRRIDLATAEVTTVAGHTHFAGSDKGRGDQATFNGPISVAISPIGNVALVADFDSHAIRQIDLSTGEVTTLAGQTSSLDDEAGFSEPFDVAVSLAGDLALVSNAHNQPLWRIDLSTGVVMPLTTSSRP